MAVVTVESAMENVLEEAGALPRHCRIALNRLKVTLRTVAAEDLDLPLTLGLVSDAVNPHLCHMNMQRVARPRQNDLAARGVVIPRDGEAQKTFILGSRFGQDRGHARWSRADSARTSSNSTDRYCAPVRCPG